MSPTGFGEEAMEDEGKLPYTTLAMSVLGGTACCTLAAYGLHTFRKADWFNDPGPYTGPWSGYNKADFVGLVLFSFLPGIGYALLYVGLQSIARLRPGPFSAGALAALGALTVATGLLGMVWGAENAQCLWAFCLGTERYKEVPNQRPEAGLGWLSIVGTGACLQLLPAGTAVAVGAVKLGKGSRPAATGVGSATAAMHQTRSPVLALALVVSALLAFFVATLYLPNSWEYFTPARIAKNALVTPVPDHDKCASATEWFKYTCPELGWATMRTRSLKVMDGLVLKLYPSNVIFFTYLVVVPVAAVALRSTRLGRLRLKKQIALPLVGAFTVGELLTLTATVLMLSAFFYYWAHDHNYNGYWGGDNEPGVAASERWARSFGQLAVAFMSLLFFPASRNSVMHEIFGTSWEAAIWAHRWLGYGMLAASLAHMSLWYKYYAEVGQFPQDVFDVPMLLPQGVDNFTVPLVTLTTWTLFLCMGVFALPVVRRRCFELFYYTHLYAAYLSVPAVLYHAAAGWEYLLPGLTVWLVDRIVRMARSAAAVQVLSVRTYDDVTEIYFAKPGMHVRAGQFVFVNIPEVSIFEWHPFTLSSGAPSSHVSLHIKSMGPKTWTDRLNQLASRPNRSLTLAVDGPHGHPADFADYSSIIFVAGGIGVTPCVSLLSSLRGQGLRLSLLWTVRDAAMVSAFSGVLANKSDAPPPETDTPLLARVPTEAEAHQLKVFVTRGEIRPEDQALERHVPGLSLVRGRPNLQQEFSAAADEVSVTSATDESPAAGALVFACGPEELVQDAQAAALSCGFHFHRETFLL